MLGTLFPAAGGAVALVCLRRTPVPEVPAVANEVESADAAGLKGALDGDLRR